MRARLLHPEFSKHEALGDLSHSHRLLWAMLPMLADKVGLLEDRPRRIQADLFPYDPPGAVDVDAMLNDLADAGFLVRYEAEGQRLISIPNFLRWQKPHKRERESVLKPPTEQGQQKASPRRAQGKPRADPGPAAGRKSPPVSDPVSDPVAVVRDPAESVPAEAPEPSPPAAPPSPLVAYLTGTWPDLDRAKAETLQARGRDAYPGIDLLAEAKKAAAWEACNPTRKKTKHGQFLNAWWSRAQQEASRNQGPRALSPPQRLPEQPRNPVPSWEETQAEQRRKDEEYERARAAEAGRPRTDVRKLVQGLAAGLVADPTPKAGGTP